MQSIAGKSPVRVGVIGAGRWGPNLIRNFHNRKSSEVAWVVDLDADRLREVKARFPEVDVSHDASAVLEDSSVDAVVIATPARTHYELARGALEASKHCLVEKPLTDSAANAEALVDIAARVGRLLLVGHVFLHNPAIRKVKEYIDDGTIGDVQYVSMVRTNLGPGGIDVNVAWDLATHDVSIANYWLQSSALRVSASGGRFISPDKEDTVFATLTYPGNRLVNINVSWLNPHKQREIIVVGNRRMLTVDDLSITEPIRIHDKSIVPDRSRGYVDTFGAFQASVRDGDIVIPRVATGEPLLSECEHFIDCIANGTTPVNDGRGALSVVRTIEAINRSVAGHGCEQEV